MLTPYPRERCRQARITTTLWVGWSEVDNMCGNCFGPAPIAGGVQVKNEGACAGFAHAAGLLRGAHDARTTDTSVELSAQAKAHVTAANHQ